jgi:hypothetical protein
MSVRRVRRVQRCAAPSLPGCRLPRRHPPSLGRDILALGIAYAPLNVLLSFAQFEREVIVSRPMLEVVLNDWVTETNET